jgi:hypothetical protein
MSTDAVTAEKLQAVYENSEQVKTLNSELGQIIYGNDEQKSHYDMFWDSFQDNGKRTSYPYGFYNNYWNDDTFKPKYDISPKNAINMFKANKITDIRPEKIGVNIDFSKATETTGAFNGAYTKYIGAVDLSSITGSKAEQMFAYNYYTQSIEKLIVHENMTFPSFFQNSNAFQHIIVEGIIAENISIHASHSLDKLSIISFVNALSNTVSGKTFTVNKTAVNKAFKTADDLTDGSDSSVWLTLISTKPNWTITLS